MAASLSMDLRERIESAYEAGNISLQDVANRFSVSRWTLGKPVRRFRTEQSLTPHTNRCGRKRSIYGDTKKSVDRHLRTYPEATLEKRLAALCLNFLSGDRRIRTCNDG